MKVYFLVEGRRTEPKVYTAWLSHLLPELAKLTYVDEDVPHSYFLISAQGYPSLLTDFLPPSVEDVNRVGAFNYLVVCLDADEESVQDRIDEIHQALQEQRLRLVSARLIVIIQNRCFESWLLGNRRIVVRNPTSPSLASYLNYYDVRVSDPELLPNYPGFSTTAQFHLEYLREIFRERRLTYTKKSPGHVLDRTYLDQLRDRVTAEPTHLQSLQLLFELCARIKSEIAQGF